MSERYTFRKVIAGSTLLLLGLTACSQGSGDTIEACGEGTGIYDTDNSFVQIHSGGDIATRFGDSEEEHITFEELQTFAEEVNTGVEDERAHILGIHSLAADAVDAEGELACYSGDTLYLRVQGQAVYDQYSAQVADAANCRLLEQNPAYQDLNIDC